MITVNEKDTWNFESEMITVNDFAIENSDFASNAGISPVLAGIVMGFAKVVLAIGEFTGIFSKIISVVM